MTSPSVWKALDSYADIFQRFETIPIVWDKNKRMFLNVKNFQKLRVFHFNITIIDVIRFMGTVMFLLIRELFSKQRFLPILNILLLVTGFLLTLLGVAIAVGITKFGDQIVKQWNDLNTMIDGRQIQG